MISIAICGGGPAGLTLARLLEKAELADFKITIFEKDPSPKARFYQGGTLDLHPDTGLAAIREAGLWDEFSKHARYEGEELYMVDKDAIVYLHMKDAPQIPGFDARPEIDRETLKELLLHSVKPETIQWGKKVQSIDRDARILSFADGTKAGPFDLIVGAEGAWSKVRATVSDHTPSYSGICGMAGNIDASSAGEVWEELSKMVGQGSYFSFSDGKSLMAQRMGDGSLKLGTWLQKPATWPAEVAKTAGGDEDKTRMLLEAEFEGWDDRLKRLITKAHRFRPWPLYELPIGHKWEHRQGWTLIGDSAHVMTPFAGEGVNAAMRDALDLSATIIQAVRTSERTLDQAVAEYEESLFPRARQVQEETAHNKSGMFRADAPVGFLANSIAMVAKESGHDFDKGLLAWVPLRKTAYSIFWSIWLFGYARRSVRRILSQPS